MLLALSIVSGVICFLGGAFYGILPLREQELTAKQKTLTQTASIVVFGLVIILILTKQDLASWIAIGATFAGFGVGKIPPLRNFMTSHWKIFRAKNAKTLSPRKAKKRQQKAQRS